ncbi:MAG: hypothetical protein WDO69_32875 [Pseudomonadota bacterium]
MSAIRLPLLCAFAGGCLSSAVLFGVWRADTVATAAQQQLARSSELLAAALAATKAEHEREALQSVSRAPSQVAPEDAPRADAADHRDSPSEPSRDAQDPGSAAPAAAGSAVADVLMNLEAAYRQRATPAAPEEAPVALDRSRAPASTIITTAQAEPPPEVAAQAVAPDPPVLPPAAPPVTPIATPAPITPVAVAVLPAEVPPPPDAAPAFAAMDQRAPDVHYGDVNQNTYNITNVRQGDVYVTQQQIALMQYMQLLGASSAAQPTLAQPTHSPHGSGYRAAHRQPVPFPSTITNPDNPWGFNFSPPHLVH